MQRARAQIQYPSSGSPGVITLYTRTTLGENAGTAQLTVDRLHDALNAGHFLFCSDTLFVSDTFVDTIDPATGSITGSDGVTPWTLAGGTGTQYLPQANQICVTWKTAAVIAGRRVRGRTFLGPLAKTELEDNGTPLAAALTSAGALADAWVNNGLTSTFAVVWHRPVGGSGGTAEDITAHSIKDKFAILRSRRD